MNPDLQDRAWGGVRCIRGVGSTRDVTHPARADESVTARDTPPRMRGRSLATLSKGFNTYFDTLTQHSMFSLYYCLCFAFLLRGFMYEKIRAQCGSHSKNVAPVVWASSIARYKHETKCGKLSHASASAMRTTLLHADQPEHSHSTAASK